MRLVDLDGGAERAEAEAVKEIQVEYSQVCFNFLLFRSLLIERLNFVSGVERNPRPLLLSVVAVAMYFRC